MIRAVRWLGGVSKPPVQFRLPKAKGRPRKANGHIQACLSWSAAISLDTYFDTYFDTLEVKYTLGTINIHSVKQDLFLSIVTQIVRVYAKILRDYEINNKEVT